MHNVKQEFFSLCQDYNALGMQFETFAANPTNDSFEPVLERYRIIGKQLKLLGHAIESVREPTTERIQNENDVDSDGDSLISNVVRMPTEHFVKT